jgi:hypothetical protein
MLTDTMLSGFRNWLCLWKKEVLDFTIPDKGFIKGRNSPSSSTK